MDEDSNTNCFFEKKVDLSRVFWTTLSFLIPSWGAFLAYWFVPLWKKSPNFDVFNRIDSLSFISKASASNTSISSLRDVLTWRLEPFCLLSKLLDNDHYQELFSILGYFLGLGFAALMMCICLRKTIGISVRVASVLAVCYSLTAENLPFFSIPSYRMLVCLFPILIMSQVRFIKGEKNGFIFQILSSILVFSSSPFGLIYGLPFALMMSILLSLCLKKTFIATTKTVLSSFALTAISMLISAPFILNWLMNSRHVQNIKDVASNLSINFTSLDYLERMLLLKAPTTLMSSPNSYVSIFAAFLFLLFIFNEVIPFRIRFAVSICVFLSYLFSAISILDSLSCWLYSTSGSYQIAYSISSFLIIFFAAVSYGNLSKMPTKTISLCLVCALGFIAVSSLTITNSSTPRTSHMLSALVLIAIYVILTRAVPSRSFLEKLLALVILCPLLINLSYVLALKGKLDTSKAVYEGILDTSDLTYHQSIPTNEAIFPYIDSSSPDEFSFAVCLGDLSKNVDSYGLIDNMNLFSHSVFADPIFTKIPPTEGNGENISILENGPSYVSLTYDLTGYSDSRFAIVSTFDNEALLNITTIDSNIIDKYYGPFCEFIDSDLGEQTIAVKLSFSDINYSTYGSFALYAINDSALSDMSRKIHSSTSGNTTVQLSDICGNLYSAHTVLTSIDYDKSLAVKINGKRVSTFSYMGKLAFNTETEEENFTISISEDMSSFFLGVGISVATSTLVVLLYVTNRFFIPQRNLSLGRKGAAGEDIVDG